MLCSVCMCHLVCEVCVDTDRTLQAVGRYVTMGVHLTAWHVCSAVCAANLQSTSSLSAGPFTHYSTDLIKCSQIWFVILIQFTPFETML